MARYSLEFAKSVRKDLKRIPKGDVSKILKATLKLTEDPRPVSSKKLKNEELFRIRVGNYRILYEIHDERLVVFVVKIGQRKDIYRK